MALDKQDLAFKTLISKEFTTPERQFFQEVTTNTLDVNTTDIIAAAVPQSASLAVSQGIAKQYQQFILTPDLTYPTKVFYFCSGSGFTPGVDTYTGSLVQRDFLSDKYGVSYSLALYDFTNNQIFPTDPINWFFNYKTGILSVANPESGSYATPYKISVYQYVGTNLSESLASIESRIQNLDTRQIITGSITASVSNVGSVFSVESASIPLFTVTSGSQIFATSFSGSFTGSGAGLTDIPAGAISGLNLSQIASGSISASVNPTTKTFTVYSGSTELFKVDSSSSVIATSFSGSFSGSGADLSSIPASAIVGLNLSRIATGSVSASLLPSSTNSFQVVSGSNVLVTVTNTGVVSASLFSGSFIGTGSNLVDLRIGVPSDGGYGTGFFDTFTSGTKLSDAIDEISAAFLDLAPAQAARLTGTTMTRNSPSSFTAYLAAGLNADHWYVNGGSANNSLAGLVAATNVQYVTIPFRAGKVANLTPTNVLVGGVTSSIGTGSQTPVVTDTRALTSGIGSTGTVSITALGQYNTFWVTASTALNYTIAKTGSVSFNVSADNGAGSTNTSTIFYVGGGSDFPAPSLTTQSVVVSGQSYNYLSGIAYLSAATFGIGFTGSNVFNPVYQLNQVNLNSAYFSSIDTGSNSPFYTDTLRLYVNRSLEINKNSGQSGITGTITIAKPQKTSATATVTLTTDKVNSYTSAPATNNIEYFLDESRRYANLNTSTWNSTSTLTNGNLQVQNGRLVHGQYGGDYPAFTGDQQYFRIFTPASNASFKGNFDFSTGASGFSSISPWGTNAANTIEIAFARQGDITGGTVTSTLFDFGRASGTSATVGGVTVNGIKQGSVGPLSGDFSMGTENTGTGYVILWIKYIGLTTTRYLGQLTLSITT